MPRAQDGGLVLKYEVCNLPATAAFIQQKEWKGKKWLLNNNCNMAAHAVLDAPVTSPVVFRVGDYFTSFLKLEEKIKSYEQSNSVQLWKREARTVASATKRVDRYLKPDLKYYQLKYCYIHGEKSFKPMKKE